MKISQKVVWKYEWFFSLCREKEPRPLQQVPFIASGLSALEAFHVFESTGKLSPCKEPLLLEKYMQGKIWHGVTVKTIAESLVEGLVSDDELLEYPTWVMDEIIQQAGKLTLAKFGFVPLFIKTGIPTKRV